MEQISIKTDDDTVKLEDIPQYEESKTPSEQTKVKRIISLLGPYLSRDDKSNTSTKLTQRPVIEIAPEKEIYPEPSQQKVQELCKTIFDQVNLLSIMVQDVYENCSTCEKVSKRNNGLALEVDSLRNGWMREKKNHSQTTLELEKVQYLLASSDATFREISMSRDGHTIVRDGIPLSQIAWDALSSYCDERRQKHWDDSMDTLNQKASRIRKRAGELLHTNETYYEFAKKFNTELNRYQQWLQIKAHSLDDNYNRYCQIMQEQGAEPELMYNDSDQLQKSEAAYLEAWKAREAAAHKAIETAYLEGTLNLFMGSM